MQLKKQTKKKYPSKLTLNMAMREKSPLSPAKVIPSLLLVLLGIGLFTKFAVIDRIYGVSMAEHALYELQDQVQAVTAELEDYSEVQDRYDRGTYALIPSADQELLLRSGLLDTMEQYLMSAAQVTSVNLADNLMSMELEGITLEGMSLVVQRLSALPEVANVEVYTVNKGTMEDQGVPTVSMLLTFVGNLAPSEAEPVQPESAEAEGGEG